jgi:hypothetical protein
MLSLYSTLSPPFFLFVVFVPNEEGKRVVPKIVPKLVV